MKTITILGGSSPFTIALIDAILKKIEHLPCCKIVLQGRNIKYLTLIAAYGVKYLQSFGWQVVFKTSLHEALEGADIVLHQIRYGGLEVRYQAEQIAQKYALPADETLGPSGLFLALKTIPAIHNLVDIIKQSCPGAWVLNLTNPLSIVTAQLIFGGLKQAIGLCELPIVTLQNLAKLLQVDIAQLEWDYTGLNHRGFLHNIYLNKKDCIEILLNEAELTEFESIDISIIRKLHAIPTKYFKLITNKKATASHRANYLGNLRETIITELQMSLETSPPSLKNRYLEWYSQSVVPLFIAILSDKRSQHIVNIMTNDAIVAEKKILLNHQKIELLPECSAGTLVENWCQHFIAHEKAVLQAVLNRTEQSIKQALALDPLLSLHPVEKITKTIMKNL